MFCDVNLPPLSGNTHIVILLYWAEYLIYQEINGCEVGLESFHTLEFPYASASSWKINEKKVYWDP